MQDRFFRNTHIVTITADMLRAQSIQDVVKGVPVGDQYKIEGLVFSYIQPASKNGSSNPNFLQLAGNKHFRLFISPALINQYDLVLSRNYLVTAFVTRQVDKADRIIKIAHCEVASRNGVSAAPAVLSSSIPALAVPVASHNAISWKDAASAIPAKLPKEKLDLVSEFAKKFTEFSHYLGKCNRGFGGVDRQSLLDSLVTYCEELFNSAPNYSESVEDALLDYQIERKELEARRLMAMDKILSENAELVQNLFELLEKLSPQSYQQSFEQGVLWLYVIATIPATFCNYPCTLDSYILLTMLSSELKRSTFFTNLDLFHDIDLLLMAMDKLQQDKRCQFDLLSRGEQQEIFNLLQALKQHGNQTMRIYSHSDEAEYVQSIHVSFLQHADSISATCLSLLNTSEVSEPMVKPVLGRAPRLSETPLVRASENVVKNHMLKELQNVFAVQVGTLGGWEVDAYMVLPVAVYPPDSLEEFTGASGLIHGIVFELGEQQPSNDEVSKQQLFNELSYWVYRCTDLSKLREDLMVMRFWLKTIFDELAEDGYAAGSSSRTISEEGLATAHLTTEAITAREDRSPMHSDTGTIIGEEDRSPMHSDAGTIVGEEDRSSMHSDAGTIVGEEDALSALSGTEEPPSASEENQAAHCMQLQQRSNDAKQLVQSGHYEEAAESFAALINQADADAEPILLALNTMRYLELKDNKLQQPLKQLEKKHRLLHAKRLLQEPLESSAFAYEMKNPLAKQIQLELEKINNQLGCLILTALGDDKNIRHARVELLSYAYTLVAEKSKQTELIEMLANRLEKTFTESGLYQHLETIYQPLLDNDEPGFYLTASAEPTMMLQILALQKCAKIELMVVGGDCNKTYVFSAGKDIASEFVVEYSVHSEEFRLLSHRELSIDVVEEQQPSLISHPIPQAAPSINFSVIPKLVKLTNQEKERLLANEVESYVSEQSKSVFASVLNEYTSELEKQYWHLQADLARIKATIQDTEATFDQSKRGNNHKKNKRDKEALIVSLAKSIEVETRHYQITLDSLNAVVVEYTKFKEQDVEVMTKLRVLADEKMARQKKEVVVTPPVKKSNKQEKSLLSTPTAAAVEPEKTKIEKLWTRIWKYYKENNHLKVIEKCNLLISLSYENIAVYYLRSNARYWMGNYPDALADINTALQCLPAPGEKIELYVHASWCKKYLIISQLYQVAKTASPPAPRELEYRAELTSIAAIIMDSSTPGYNQSRVLFFPIEHASVIEDYDNALIISEDELAKNPNELRFIAYKAHSLFHLNCKKDTTKEDPTAIQAYHDLLAYITESIFVKGSEYYLQLDEIKNKSFFTEPFKSWVAGEWARYCGNKDVAREQFGAILKNNQHCICATLALDACTPQEASATLASTPSM